MVGGWAPPPVYVVDVSALPQAPEGSDARTPAGARSAEAGAAEADAAELPAAEAEG